MHDLPIDVFDVLLEFCEPEDVESFLQVSPHAQMAADKIIFHSMKLTNDIGQSKEQLSLWQTYDCSGRFNSSPRILHILAFHILGPRMQYNAFICDILSIPSICKNVCRLILEFSHPSTLALFCRPEFSFIQLNTIHAHIPWYLFIHSLPHLASLTPTKCIDSVAVHGSIHYDVMMPALPAVTLPPGGAPVSVKKLLLPYASSSPATYPHIPRAVVSGRVDVQKLSTFIVEITGWWQDRDIALVLGGMVNLRELIINACERADALDRIHFPPIRSLEIFGYHGDISFYNVTKEIGYVPQSLLKALQSMQCDRIQHLSLDIFYKGPTTIDDELESEEPFKWKTLSRFLGEKQNLHDVHFNYWLDQNYDGDLAYYHTEDVHYYFLHFFLNKLLYIFLPLGVL
ncbi:MAG: hypothetical protein NXY57DRAFT_1044574 [Lentinula lateritia]|uniref:F-box domain-containing protein n=1 Tax=Lentinula lateritia TaxID=40482 RepID=A0ABQ8V506_9AGAR|nr:MAG: hypothetical protein NXY57DRAFT_1044574 [Lentinula lateritia]KAJ4469638.1 hypothetical protein C8R41DRAFT_852898 [Lentinula lateritia]